MHQNLLKKRKIDSGSSKPILFPCQKEINELENENKMIHSNNLSNMSTEVLSTMEALVAKVCKKYEETPNYEEDIPPRRSSVHAMPAKQNALQKMLPPPPNPMKAQIKIRARRVCLMHSQRYEYLCGLIRAHEERDSLLYALINATGISRYLRIMKPASATEKHLENFHAKDYINALKKPESYTETVLRQYGLEDDCEVFPGMWEYSIAVAGATLQCASLLLRGEVDVAINWGGGRHHAKKASAAGFCYVNDVVLAALHVVRRGRLARVLYIDIDVHHPDGVEEAFYCTDRVFTLSFHKFSPGFFPASGSGGPEAIGEAKGQYHNLNVPIQDGCSDETFVKIFSWVVKRAVKAYRPQMIIMQCGCDSLASDPLGPMNLTSKGFGSCVGLVRSFKLPLLLLGGGGYNPRDTARCWTAATAAAIGPDVYSELPSSIPFHEHFERYGPDFQLHSSKINRQDLNTFPQSELLKKVSASLLGVQSLRTNNASTS